MSSSSGYVVIPRCPVIFDGANYPDFVAFMRVHMRGLRLWGVLSGEVSCPCAPLLLWILFRRRHLFLVRMLLRLTRMLLRVLIGVLLLRMICSFSSTPVLLRPIGWI
jgi:hypothetical protein